MELSIQERLKDLRVARGLTLEQLAEEINLSKSALGSYEGDKLKDISHYAIIKLAKFYGVTADYLLGLSQTKNHRTTAPKGRHSPFGAPRSPRDRCRRCWPGRPLGLGCWHTAAVRPPAPGCPRGQHGEHSR